MTEPQELAQESPREFDVVERARQAVDAWDRFAVWAPTRVPGVRVCLDLVRDLVAEVERLTAERDEARTEVERLEADLDGAAYRAGRKQGELADVTRELERLRTDLARMTGAEAGRGVGEVGIEGPHPVDRASAAQLRRALDGEVSGE